MTVNAVVNWTIRYEGHGTAWFLTMTVSGRAFDVARVEAVDRDAAVKAIATQIELALQTWQPRTDE